MGCGDGWSGGHADAFDVLVRVCRAIGHVLLFYVAIAVWALWVIGAAERKSYPELAGVCSRERGDVFHAQGKRRRREV